MSNKKYRKLPVLGLVMIVKNESHIIVEALDSISEYIDVYVISDTGSTDGTQDVIRNYFKERNIPGHIFQDEWEDFGTNRTILLRHAREKMQHAWMLDADDIVKMPSHIVHKKDFQKMLEPHYIACKVGIVDESDSVFYWRTQIFNMKKAWRYEGVLHEYPVLAEPRKNTDGSNMKELPCKVVSRRLGSRNKMDILDKYRMDADMLLKGLEKEPMNSRYMFYLAQSYRDCEEYEKAVQWYITRAEIGGWYEEVFYSYYMAGKMSMFNLKNPVNGMRYSLKAFSVHPKRVESINTLIQYYKLKSEFRTALLYAKKVKDISFPKEDGLFLENDLYSHGIKQDYKILSFLCFEWNTIDHDMDDNMKTRSVDHFPLLASFPLIAKGKSTEIMFPDHLIPRNPNPLSPELTKYRTFNPAVARHPVTGEMWVNVRCANFDVRYQPTDKDGMIRTENFMATLDMKRIYKLVDKSAFGKSYRESSVARILGYEDIRLFFHHNHWCFLANNDEIHGYINSPQVVFGRLANEPNEDTLTWDIEYVIHLKFPFQQKVEKNWVPMIHDDVTTPLQIVYSYDPLMILTPDLATGFCTVAHNVSFTFPDALQFPQPLKIRNSTPFIPFQGGWLGMGHVVYFLQEYGNQRVYYSIFLWMSDDFKTARVSNLFHLEDHIIEFANGMVRTTDGQIMVSYSLSDSIPKTVCFEENAITNMWQ